MASTLSKDEPLTTLAAFGAEVALRRAAAEARTGPLVIPRNTGTRRTPSKRALLAEIEKAGAEW